MSAHCEAISRQGTVCERGPEHEGCHEAYVDGDGRRWWGDVRDDPADLARLLRVRAGVEDGPYRVFVVQARSVGHSTLAMGRTAVVVARSPEEAEGKAIVKLDLEGKRICPEAEARTFLGTGQAERAGWGPGSVWLLTGAIPWRESRAAVYGTTLSALMEAYEDARELNLSG